MACAPGNDGYNQVRCRNAFSIARGKSIARAVDVAEIVRNRFVNDAKVQNISIKTEELDKSKVPSIEITLGK